MRRVRLLLMIVAVTAVTACAGKVAPAPEPRPEPAAPAKLAGQVLVYRDAWLDDGSLDGTNRARLDDDETRFVGDVAVMQIIADNGPYVEVTNLKPPDGQEPCYGVHDELLDFELHFLVRREDLAEVTPRPVVVPFEDGTAITLRAGVAVGPAAAVREARVDEMRFSLPLAADDVGLAYTPSPPLDAQVGTDAVQGYIHKDGDLRYGPHRIDGRPEQLDVLARAPGPNGQALVSLATRCGAYRVLVAPEHIHETGFGSGYGNGGGSGGASYYATAGEAVFWPDGRPAGRVLVNTTLFGEATVIGDVTCYEKLIRHDGGENKNGVIRLCFGDRP